MDFQLLPVFRDLDGAAALQRFVDYYDGSHGDAGEMLVDATKVAVDLSVDLSKHGLRKLALALRDGSMDVDGWRFATLPQSRRFDIAFTMNKDGAGYAVRLRIDPEMTAEATERDAVFQRQRWAKLDAVKDGLSDADFAKAKWEILFVETIPEEDALKADPASYKPIDECSQVDEVCCVAYGDEKHYPEGRTMDGITSLKKVLEAWDSKKYQLGNVFKIYPDVSFDRGWREHPQLGNASSVHDLEAALFSLRLAGRGIVAAGLESAVADFVVGRGAVSYTYVGDEQSATIYELAGASVATTGMVTDDTVADMSRFWITTATMDVNKAAENIETVVSTLGAQGHFSADSRYDCNDLDDFAWIETTDSMTTAVWYKSQNGCYRIDHIQEYGETVGLRFASISEKTWKMGDSSPEASGKLLCEFERSDDRFKAGEHGAMTMRNIRDINNILLGLGSIACCLEDDYEIDREARP